jgi:hypothetical protein
MRSEAKAKPRTAETRPSPVEETNAPPPLTSPSEETTAAPPPVALKSDTAVVKTEALIAKSDVAIGKSEAAVAEAETPVAKPEVVSEKHETTAVPPTTGSEPPRALGRRQAARVSIEPSSGSKRFYVLRVLEEGEAVPEKGLEALLVLTDPNARFPDG